ncbi:MAG: acyl-CoA dehydrogenase [Candidatus Binatia bacterium]|nr:MAG: acyl-CoA dehydrogenase [Candidatus Binatia bacterium]
MLLFERFFSSALLVGSERLQRYHRDTGHAMPLRSRLHPAGLPGLLGRVRYEFTPEQLAWRDEVRAFLAENVTPELLDEMRELGNEGQGPHARAFQKKLQERGWWGLAWPKEYGGLERSAIEQWIFVDELETAGAPMLPLTVTSVAPTIMRVGTEEQKKTWLPRIRSGEVEFALGYSEPDAGTDLASLRTRAVLEGDHWVVQGQKMWNTMAHTATHNWLAVRTEPDAPKHKGISILIVPMDAPGVTVQPIYVWPGLRTNAVFFDNVRVPRDYLIGERGMGFYYAAMALNFERLSIGSVGMCRRFFRELVAYVREAVVDGRPLKDDPWVRERVARLAVDIEAARMLGLETAWAIDQGRVPAAESSMAKVFVSELAHRLADFGTEILGLQGQLHMNEPRAAIRGRLQWLYRTAPMLAFGGGTNEVQRNIVAMLGYDLPRK